MNRLLSGALLVTVAWSAAGVRAADPVTRALAAPVTVTWQGLPLRSAAVRLGELGGCPVVIDRRIDPDTSVALDAVEEPLADVLGKVAEAAGAEVVAYAGHLRLVPSGGSAALRSGDAARTGELRTVAAAARRGLETRAEWSWPDGATPRGLVESAAGSAGLALSGLDDLPHDHFPAASLPPLALADRIDLVLAHFDRRVAWRPRSDRRDPAAYSIVPLEPDAGTTAVPLRRAQRADRRRAPADTAATYTLTVAAPLDELLATLARRFGLELELDTAALRRRGVAPGEIVRLELRDASREQLLDAILEPRGLTWRIVGDSLTVDAQGP